MKTYRFYVFNNALEKGFKSGKIMQSTGKGGIPKDTWFCAYKCPNKRAAEFQHLAKTAEFCRNEHSNQYMAALKAFMASGYQSRFKYVVDENLNVTMVEA